jgi:tetratricopeptide (TPR) repeat protein
MTNFHVKHLASLAAAAIVGVVMFASPLSAMLPDPPQADPAAADKDKKATDTKPDPKATDTKAPAAPAATKGNETKGTDPKGADPKASDPTASGKSDPKASGKSDKKSELDFRDGYRHAYDQIEKGEYAAAIATLHALGRDEHSDVATAIGFASRKLGRYDDAKFWYDKALAANPKNARTWQYYGMWHLEQGNRLKAEDYLQTIRLICGSDGCKEFKALKDALDGNLSY